MFGCWYSPQGHILLGPCKSLKKYHQPHVKHNIRLSLVNTRCQTVPQSAFTSTTSPKYMEKANQEQKNSDTKTKERKRERERADCPSSVSAKSPNRKSSGDLWAGHISRNIKSLSSQNRYHHTPFLFAFRYPLRVRHKCLTPWRNSKPHHDRHIACSAPVTTK